jgi:hypothetical protein
MSTLTIRQPDDKHQRLKALAENRRISVNKLSDELATIAIANHDVRLCFATRSARGDGSKALPVLEHLGDL